MDEYWIISVPGRPSTQETWKTVCKATKTLSQNLKLVHPDFKFGTFDDLVRFTDEAAAVDAFLELLLSKIVQHLGELIQDINELQEFLKVDGISVQRYLSNFRWDNERYPTKKPPIHILKEINDLAKEIFNNMKNHLSDFNELKYDVQKMEAKHTGSLVVRDLSDFVTKEDFVLNSKFFTTLLVIVPSIDIENWKLYYEHFWHGVVPGTSKMLFRDGDFALFTLTIFKGSLEGFKEWVRKSRIVIRPFVYDEKEIMASKVEEKKKKLQMTLAQRNLILWLTKHYNESIIMYIHLKVLRALGESIFRFGPQTSFIVVLMNPLKCHSKCMKKLLLNLYGYLDSGAYIQPLISDDEDNPIQGLSPKEYYPFVFLNISMYGDSKKAFKPVNF